MANQYQNFTNPTIVPDEKYGWQAAAPAASQATGNIANYLMQRQSQGEGLQLQQAQQLANAQAISMAYTGRRNPNIDAMLSQNPFGRFIMPQGNAQPNTGTPQPGNNIMSGTLMGMSPKSAMFSSGGNVTPVGMPDTSQSATNPNSQPGQGMSANFSPFNPISSNPVVSDVTSEFQPYVGMIPKSIKTQNPQAEASLASAKTFGSKQAEQMMGAQESESRDIQQLGMVKNALKPLVDSYNQVYDKKVLGMGAAGDAYGSNIVKNSKFVPRGLQDKIVGSDVQQAAGQFLSNKNEIITKLQPLLSQQFGKEGSSRIMESLVHMSQQEIGDLDTPKDQFYGQISGTISSLYRIAKASQAYAKDLSQSGKPIPDPDTAAQEISRRMAFQNLSDGEQKELKGIIDDTLGQNKPKASSSKADFNPVSKASMTQPEETAQSQTFTVDGKTYNIPADKVASFKKAKGIK